MLDFSRFDHLPKQITQTPSVSLFDIENAALIEAAFSEKVPESTQIFLSSTLSQSPKKMFDFLAYVEQTSNKVGDKRFIKGSLNSEKLKSSLAEMGNLDVLKRNLLQAQVGKKHASMLADRYLRKAKKMDAREAKNLIKWEIIQKRGYRRGERRVSLFSTYESFRFITILFAVTNLCEEAAVNAVKRMKHHLKEAFKKVLGVTCLGAFEIEVTCRKMMRELFDRKSTVRHQQRIDQGFDSDRIIEIEKIADSEEARKLHVLESMGGYLDNSLYSDEPSELLIHFHGVVCAPSEAKFNELLKVLGQNSLFVKEPRQIVMKKLTKSYGQINKTVEENLEDIAAYITKGGNDWVSKRAYLRYKIRFSNGTPMTDQEVESLNWRSNESLRQIRKDQGGIEDLLSLSVHEINVLAMAIHKMMNLAPKGQGYLFKHGQW